MFIFGLFCLAVAFHFPLRFVYCAYHSLKHQKSSRRFNVSETGMRYYKVFCGFAHSQWSWYIIFSFLFLYIIFLSICHVGFYVYLLFYVALRVLSYSRLVLHTSLWVNQ